jgi:hypothetical protein
MKVAMHLILNTASMPIHSMKSRFSHGEFRVLKQKAQNQEQHF